MQTIVIRTHVRIERAWPQGDVQPGACARLVENATARVYSS
jgi:hypothetical protein